MSYLRTRRASGGACSGRALRRQRRKARCSRLCQEGRRLVLPRLVPGVLIAAHWPLRAGAAARGARGRHCLRASLQLPGLAPQASCARLTLHCSPLSVARRSSACRVGLYPWYCQGLPAEARLVAVCRRGLPDLQAQLQCLPSTAAPVHRGAPSLCGCRWRHRRCSHERAPSWTSGAPRSMCGRLRRSTSASQPCHASASAPPGAQRGVQLQRAAAVGFAGRAVCGSRGGRPHGGARRMI